MSSLQFSGCRAMDLAMPFLSAFSSPFCGRDLDKAIRISVKSKARFSRGSVRVYATSNVSSSLKMNLNEYLVTLEKPLGIRFALSVDGKIFVHALKKGGNAEKSRIIMVGDTLKKASESSGGGLLEIKDFGDAQKMMTEKTGSFSLVLERPFSPFPLNHFLLISDIDLLFNRGRVPIVTWNKAALASNLRTSSESCGNSGFVTFSSKNLTCEGWKLLNDQQGPTELQTQKNILAPHMSQLICIFSEEDSGDGEWAHGSFPLDEYIKALDRSKGELYYDQSLGMRCSKITEQIYVGSCIQMEADVANLSVGGITAVLNFQSGVEAENWGINPASINEACQSFGILMINYPIRPAIAWATWDLIAMVENGKHDGPATHAVTFVWNGQEGEDVFLVGDFTGNWKDPVKATHKGGSRYEVEMRLAQGKYYYKYIINGQWRHSISSPTERDEGGNVNNILIVGDVANVRPFVQQQKKDVNVVKVIERPLTESERFMLAKAARCTAFSVCPIKLAPK
ncbi:phosphoglucan phosphatase LSF1, chloroplastic-like isoform X2 [Tripterygium wilfordii]|uniref:phosphoglucan phosphatase LSF1, chloroplastic-like isoform X2 n=1 Tax=Tripterygium wilfordii TaxID=458696 RepID=UPI0018F7E4EF|nr:phosphoglucan phosphatase LSF1, chloroplastic-like isoform X2 [Tripterygium wilfordii]